MIWCPCLGTDSSRHNRVGTGRGGAAGPGGDQRGHGEGRQHHITRLVTCHVSRVSRARPWRATSGRRRSPGCGGGWWPRWACWWPPSCSTPRCPSSSPPRWTVTTSHGSSRVTCHAPGLNTGQLGLATPASTATTLVTATLLGYGGARAGALGLNELR